MMKEAANMKKAVAGAVISLLVLAMPAQAQVNRLLDERFWQGSPTFEEIRSAIDGGANVNARSDDGCTPLHFAAWYHSDARAVALLLEEGADVNAYDKVGRTALHWVKTPETATMLLNWGADVSARAKGGGMPLHYMAYEGRPEMATLLLRWGADVDAREDGGYTPLDFAKNQNNRAVELVLQAHLE